MIGGVLAAMLTARQPTCLLLIAPACVILGHTCLAPRACARFGWESANLPDPEYDARRAGHLAIDLLAVTALHRAGLS